MVVPNNSARTKPILCELYNFFPMKKINTTLSAMIVEFKNNGTKKEWYTPPRTTEGRQGHQIFIESRKDAKNDVTITGNEMRETFADGIAVDVFDQPDGVEMRIKIIGNTISGCGRNGLGIASSFGPSNTNVSIESTREGTCGVFSTIVNKQNGVT